MTQPCPHCPDKDDLIQRQQREIARLRRIIEQAQAACASIADGAKETLSEHQPRGTWGFAKGTLETAEIIKRYLGNG